MANFILFVGLPASGKSYLAQKLCNDHPGEYVWLSSDAIRGELWGNEEDQQNPR